MFAPAEVVGVAVVAPESVAVVAVSACCFEAVRLILDPVPSDGSWAGERNCKVRC